MAAPQDLRSARRHYAQSALTARRAVAAARMVRPRGVGAVARVVAAHQVAQAVLSQQAVEAMLLEQRIAVRPDAVLNSAAFTTELAAVEAMIEAASEQARQSERDDQSRIDRLVESLVQEAGRAAESVAVAVRSDVYHVRMLTPPSCSRCAILAGRIYRWSTGFQRHPGCDCTMIPTTVASPYRTSPTEAVRDGQVTGLSKADMRALDDGADLAQIVNVRSKAAGLTESGQVLSRASRPTPAGIYRRAGDNREYAVRLLKAFGYVR